MRPTSASTAGLYPYLASVPVPVVRLGQIDATLRVGATVAQRPYSGGSVGQPSTMLTVAFSSMAASHAAPHRMIRARLDQVS